MRPAFTLIEVLVALVLFEFAMLALAATSAVAARNLAAANLGTKAQATARNRVELLRSSSCPAIASGTDRTRGLTEFWSVRALGQLRAVSDSIEYSLPNGRRHGFVLRAWVLCPG